MLNLPEPISPPSGNAGRFGTRWRLVGAGLSNVWRFGDLELLAPSGRLLLRGPNGTGKTTALEALWPYLLDLNQQRLAAGKARSTHLSGLMREAAEGRRRVGYLWLSFAGPGAGVIASYGVRLTFSEGGVPPVKVTPFTVPGRPLHELALWGLGREALSAEAFSDAVAALGGTTFDEDDHYVRDLATRIFATEPRDLLQLAERIRHVRNPAVLGDLSPREAADALRASLPGVSEDVIEATGEALAESDATRRAFEDDRRAADTLGAFARVWAGHAVDVTASYHGTAIEAARMVQEATRDYRRLVDEHGQAATAADLARRRRRELNDEQETTRGRLDAIERSAEYRDAGRLAELAERVASEGTTAEAKWRTLANAATQAAQLMAADVSSLTGEAEDLSALVHGVSALAPAVAGAVLLTWEETPRPPYRVGDRSADAGSELRASAHADTLRRTVAALTDRADEFGRRADMAIVHKTAHGEVATAEREAQTARGEADRLVRTAEEKAALAKRADATARAEARRFSDAAGAWLAASDEAPGFSSHDLGDVDWSEPPVALAAADRLFEAASAWAHRVAAEAEAAAAWTDELAGTIRDEAAGKRAEAQRIRTEDVLLPLPRPEWAGAGDDTVAFGAAIDWRPGVDGLTQDIVEATVAAAGLLGAILSAGGVSTAAWAVDANGPVVEPNLGALLAPDAAHPLAEAAGAVLARIALADTISDAGAAGIVIGADGTYRAGVLAAAVPEARDDALRKPARHVGARRRREAALAYADALDREAGQLDGQAADLGAQARAFRDRATRVRSVLARIPGRDPLRGAEAARVAAVEAQRDADEKAGAAEEAADRLAHIASDKRRAWTGAVTAAGLPPDVAELDRIARTGKESASQLRGTASRLDSRFRERVVRLVETVAEHDGTSELTRWHAEALQALADAQTSSAQYDELSDNIGRTAEEVLARHAGFKARLSEIADELLTAEIESQKRSTDEASLKAHVGAGKVRVDEAVPLAQRTVAELRSLFTIPGVLEATLDAEPAADDAALLGQVAAAVAGKPTFPKRSVRERADETRARLAGVWSVDPGIDHPALETYLLAHGTGSFTPIAAAAHARMLATRAEEALRAADESALRDFVIGRLPAAVAQAWTRLLDWVQEVNAKMKSASASSGVGVAVRVTIRDDLPSLVRTVYELACKQGTALRDPAAKTEAGQALHQLINAADGDDMTARVRAAVDVREWVDVVYQVMRPGEPPRNWNSRTGLSTGERRLVVLAPMLAAVAAAFDKLPAQAGRLAALDEVPSEVDETGREGLARYIAELDMDLIATSHQWDGAPGAWDGIDAHDLEQAPDGMVVAFPMLVRGLEPLEGDVERGLPSL